VADALLSAIEPTATVAAVTWLRLGCRLQPRQQQHQGKQRQGF
jgi:hypothetical protein